MTTPSAQLHSLWAKTDDAGNRHPLLWHLLDVAAVAETLWDGYAGEGFRTRFAAATGQPSTTSARAWFAWFAAMHDLGKASPHFQSQGGRWAEHAEASGMRCVGETPVLSHERIGAALLVDLLGRWGVPEGAARWWAAAVNVEHGQVLGAAALAAAASRAKHRRHPEYPPVQAEIVNLVREAVGATSHLDLHSAPAPGLLAEVAGLVKFADWLGSGPKMFPLLDETHSVRAYHTRARRRARLAVKVNRIGAWSVPAAVPMFGEQFVGWDPRPVQRVVVKRARTASLGTMLVVEAPMGQGKTEAALAAAMEFALKGATGLYFALPTQTTARTMHGRVGKWLRDTGLADQVTLNSGNWDIAANLDSTDATAVQETDDHEHPDHEGTDPASMVDHTEPSRWFRGPHRAMLGKVGVGTVDQVLLAAEPTRYNVARHAGLAGRVVVFDEVHAYDGFMSTVFCTALRWLAVLGCPVVLLSATLPDSTRHRFANAYRSGLLGADVDEPLPTADYPAVTAVTAAVVEVIPVEPPAPYEVALEHLVAGKDPAEDMALLVADRVGGSTEGCVGVVCNSVDRAVAVANAMRRAVPQAEVTLFHARFTAGDRERITRHVIDGVGKGGLRRRSTALRIVVATQVIEQSLDLDFDWMVTELAPVDLVLQRSGHLHRWAATPRPAWGRTPALVVVEPPAGDKGVPRTRDTSEVYEENAPATLLASWHLLRTRTRFTVPDDIPALIGQAYDRTAQVPVPVPADVWAARLAAETVLRDQAGLRGTNVSLPLPWGGRSWPLPSDVEPDAEGQRLRARDGADSVPVALAWRTADGLRPVSDSASIAVHAEDSASWRRSIVTLDQRVRSLPTTQPWTKGVLRGTALLVLGVKDSEATYSSGEGFTFPSNDDYEK